MRRITGENSEKLLHIFLSHHKLLLSKQFTSLTAVAIRRNDLRFRFMIAIAAKLEHNPENVRLTRMDARDGHELQEIFISRPRYIRTQLTA